jgi:putative membrane protein
MYTLIHLAVLAITVLFLARVLPDVRIRSAGTAIVVAVVFSLLNFFIGWLIGVLLILPTVLTFGLLLLIFPFVVNTILLWLTDKVMSSFKIESLGSLLMSAGAITVANAVMNYALRWFAAGHAHPILSPGPTRWI